MPVSGNRWKAILPIMGKLLAHVEKAAFPYGASTVPQKVHIYPIHYIEFYPSHTGVESPVDNRVGKLYFIHSKKRNQKSLWISTSL